MNTEPRITGELIRLQPGESPSITVILSLPDGTTVTLKASDIDDIEAQMNTIGYDLTGRSLTPTVWRSGIITGIQA